MLCCRGALIKPWIFQEYREGRELDPTAGERVAIYRRLTAYFKEHFRDDERGKRSVMVRLAEATPQPGVGGGKGKWGGMRVGLAVQ